MQPQKICFNKILVIRTDRVGDVVLSTPVLKALRENYPSAHIAIMVSPYTREIVEGNPYIDEVITYDKDKEDKGLIRFWKFVAALRKKRFDLAIVLHTKKRTNLITYFANIPRRIGYRDKNFGFLLTDKIEDARPLGLKHEVDYCLAVLDKLGIKAKDKTTYVAIKKEDLVWARNFLEAGGISKNDIIVCLHPGASCVSKRWLGMRFIELADKLVEKYYAKIILIASGSDVKIAEDIAKNIKGEVLNLAGKTNLSRLAAVLKRSQLFISNDSGPVHIASAVGTPVISIFGRNQAGLSPVRWGPIGKLDRYLHKDVGCAVCLAHNCKIGFECLKAITVDDVLGEVDSILEITKKPKN